MSTPAVDHNDLRNAPPSRFPPSSGVRPLARFTAVLGVITLLAPFAAALVIGMIPFPGEYGGLDELVYVLMWVQPILVAATLIVAAITACRAVRFSGTRDPLRHKLVWAWFVILAVVLGLTVLFVGPDILRGRTYSSSGPPTGFTAVPPTAVICAVAVFVNSRRDATTKPMVSAKVIMWITLIAIAVLTAASLIWKVA